MPPNNTPDEGLPPRPEPPDGSPPDDISAGTVSNIPDIGISPLPAPSGQTATVQNRAPAIDWAGLEYVGQVDDNLLCAICKIPFHTPVTTHQCRHTFCCQCLGRHLDNLEELGRPELCPLCRTELEETAVGAFWGPADRIVEALLEQLQVRCPGKLCKWTGPRGSLENHVKTCNSTPVPCVDGSCPKTILRGAQEEVCLHHQGTCILCDEAMEVSQVHEHRSTVCPQALDKCPMCLESFARRELPSHMRVCLVSPVYCKFRDMGCKHQGPGSTIEQHVKTCLYGLITAMEERIMQKIGPGAEVQSMTRQLQDAQHRMAAVEAEQAGLRDVSRGRPNTSPPSNSLDDNTEREQYLLETFDQLERRVSEISRTLLSRDAMQATMLRNEILPMKEQMTEIRSQLGILSMHVRWLMDVQRTRQRQNIVNAFSGNSNSESEPASAGGNSGATSSSITGRPLNGRTTPPRPSL